MGALEGLDDGKGVTGELVGWSDGAFEGAGVGGEVGNFDGAWVIGAFEGAWVDFKNFLKANNFNFETKTEKAFADALSVAKEEQLNNEIDTNYSGLVSALNDYKNKAIDQNKTQLMSLLSDEIVKRYFYREGLYNYYKANNFEIQKGVEILKNPSNYLGYLD